MNITDIRQTDFSNFLISVINSAPYGILAMNLEGEVIIANSYAREYLELPFEMKELPDKNISDCVHHIPKLKNRINRLKNGRKPFNFESFPFNNKYLTIKGRPIQNGYIITVENITKLKEIEVASLNSTFKGQELERMRLAKEIHDGLGPILSIVKLSLETIQIDLRQKATDEVIQRIENLIKMVDSATTDIRNMSRNLMPKVLNDFGLVEALENMCHHVSGRIRVNFFSSVSSKRFDKSVELGLFRIAQELINNAIRHSKANLINVQLIQHRESLLLMIEDNGKGFDESALNYENQGIGLINIESRAKALGGEFFIDSGEGKGVTATVEVPI